MRRNASAVLLGWFVLSITASPANGLGSLRADKSDNVSLVDRFRYGGGDGFWAGTDVDFSGRYAYGGHLGRDGGVHIFDVRGNPKEVGFLHCPGTQNDVAVLRPGIVALGYYESDCGRVDEGVQLLDVRNPKRIRLLGAVRIPEGTHTLTVYPGKPIIYASPGGYGGEDHQTIIDASRPRHPRIIGRFDPGAGVGCHDVAFHFERDSKLGFCAGESATQIWDVSTPAKPKIVSTIANPLIWFHHSVAVTPDGDYLAIGDEALGTAAGLCSSSVNHPTGAIWIYDIRDPAEPSLVSFFGLQRDAALALCTVHNFDFASGTRNLVAGWYGGGMNVVNLDDPGHPKEVAYFRAEDSDYWSAFYYAGRVYASGGTGLDVFKVDGIER